MALSNKTPHRFEFTDADGDKGVWLLARGLTRGFWSRLEAEYPDANERGWGMLVEKTVGCEGPAFKLAADEEFDGVTYKKGTLMPLGADKAIREHFINEVVPQSYSLLALSFLTGKESARSPEDSFRVREDGASVAGSPGEEAAGLTANNAVESIAA